MSSRQPMIEIGDNMIAADEVVRVRRSEMAVEVELVGGRMIAVNERDAERLIWFVETNDR